MGPDAAKASKSAIKIFSYIDVESRINPINQPPTQRYEMKALENTIEFKNVWFRYPAKKIHWVFKGLNLTIRKNESLAVVGESGAGKSTLVGLLLRFYDVTHGEILIDGQNIKSFDLVSLRKRMGLVMQEPILFNYSIHENIMYGKSDASNKEIKDAAQIANALEFVESSELQNAFGDSPADLL
jgi:ATP-binding cassette subfamily B (MDR/TAP) protein 1